MQHQTCEETISILESNGRGRIIILPAYNETTNDDDESSDTTSSGLSSYTNKNNRHHWQKLSPDIIIDNNDQQQTSSSSWTNNVLQWIGIENKAREEGYQTNNHQNEQFGRRKEEDLSSSSLCESFSLLQIERKRSSNHNNTRFPPYELFNSCAVTRLDLDSF